MKPKRLLCVLFLAAMVLGVVFAERASAQYVFGQKPKARFSVSQRIGYAPLIVSCVNRSLYATDFKWTVVDDARSTQLDELDDTGMNLIYIYDWPGVWPLYLEATNSFGTSLAMATITVLPSLYPTTVDVQFVGAPRAGPVGSEVRFINTTAGTWKKYLWDFGDGTSATTEDPTHKYETAGVFTVSLTLYDGSNYYTKTKVNYINITPSSTTPSPDFGATPVTGTAPHTVQFSNLVAEETQRVLWDFGDGTTGEGLNPTHTYAAPGRYTVSLSVDGATNSKTDFITTLSDSLTQRSPAAVLLENNLAQLAVLQAFREGVLGDTLFGLGVGELYQKHSLELVSILLADDALRTEAAALLLEFLPGFQAVVDGGTMTITQAQMDEIRVVVGKIADQAGPELQAFLIQALSELASGQSFAGIGVVVSPN